ncbi:MAG: LysM peptidoglycan-binding domain-containing protein [Streptococcus mitis]|nr:LysM peptidoglycan-binding domain-containing protein [Streptococcus mitis]
MRQTNVRGALSLRGFRKLRTGAIVATGVILLGLGFLAPTVSANEQDGVWVARTVAEVKADIQNIDNLSHYTIKWGDTLSAISGATGLSVDSLVEINRIANRDLIFANNKLYFSEEAFLKDGNTEVKRQRVSIDNSGSCQSYEVETKTDIVTGEQRTTVKQTTPVAVETPAVSAAKAEESVSPAPKVEEPVTPAPKSEEPATPAPKVEEPASSAPKVEEPASSAPKAEEPVVTEPKTEEPVATTPKVEEPAAPASKVEEPVTPAPKVEEPASSAPKAEEPVATTPKVEEPVTPAPKEEEPSIPAPKVEEPSTPAPKVEEPTTPAPKVEEPVTPAPKVEEPVTPAPKSEEPVATTPKAEEPEATTPKSEEPASTTPKSEEPATPAPKEEDPATSAPKAEEPAATEPKPEEPVATTPKVEEPVTPAPKAEEPATPAPKEEKPATPAPKVEEPATPASEVEEPVSPTPKAEEPAVPAPKVEEAATTTPKSEEPASSVPKVEEPATPAPKADDPAAPALKDDESGSSVESPSTGNHSDESGAPSTTPTGDSTATQPSDSTSSPVTPSEEAPVTSGETNSTEQPSGESGKSETTSESSNTPSAEATNDSGNAATSTPTPEASTSEPKSEEELKKEEALKSAKKESIDDNIGEVVKIKADAIEKVTDADEKARLKEALKALQDKAIEEINKAKDDEEVATVTEKYQNEINALDVPGEEVSSPNYGREGLTNNGPGGTTIDNESTAIGHGSGEAPTQPASEERSTSTASPTQPSSTSEGASSFRNAPSVQARARRVARSTSEADGTVNISYNFAGMPDIHGFLSDPGENNTVTIPAGTSEAQAKELVKEKIQAKIKDLAARGYHVKNDIIFEQDTTVKNYNYVVTFTKEATGTSGFRMAPAVQPRASRNRRSLEQPAPQKVKVNVFYNFDQMKDIAGFLGDINGTSLEIAEGSTNEQVKAAVESQVDTKKEELSKQGYTFKEDYVYQANGKDYNYVVTFSKAAK